MKPEFKVGDVVTYKPYKQSHVKEVRQIQTGMYGVHERDDTIFYYLSDIGMRVSTLTSGKSIVESKLFEGERE